MERMVSPGAAFYWLWLGEDLGEVGRGQRGSGKLPCPHGLLACGEPRGAHIWEGRCAWCGASSLPFSYLGLWRLRPSHSGRKL